MPSQVIWDYDEKSGVLDVYTTPRLVNSQPVGTYQCKKKRDVIKILKEQWNVPIFQRKLAANHATACENAHCEVCKCRCGGNLHGYDHKIFQQLEAAMFLDKKSRGEFVLRDDIERAIQQAVAIMKGKP